MWSYISIALPTFKLLLIEKDMLSCVLQAASPLQVKYADGELERLGTNNIVCNLLLYGRVDIDVLIYTVNRHLMFD